MRKISSVDFADGHVYVCSYVDGISFLAPAQVGDRVQITAQVCRCDAALTSAPASISCLPTQPFRSYGDFVEVEVHAESHDVRGCKQTTNVGYFCVGGSDECKAKLKFAQVVPSTVEQTERFNASLGRLLIAAVRLEGLQNDQTLDSTLSAAACSASHLLRAHDDSIWNSSSAVAVLSPSFQLDCARSLAHNDVCGLVCASADARAGEGAFETLHSGQEANGVVIKRRISGGGGLTLVCIVEIQVACSSFYPTFPGHSILRAGRTSIATRSDHEYRTEGRVGNTHFVSCCAPYQ